MLNKILTDIENNRDELINGLQQLIELPSSDGGATPAQEFVRCALQGMGFETECFREDDRAAQQEDYCPYSFTYDEGAYNVAGRLKGEGTAPSLMLFGHIDTEAETYFGRFDNPYRSYIKDGKIYGLGASDDKGGIAMMLYAVKYLKKHIPTLPYDLTVMSVMGKHGGGFGTLSALMKGYTGQHSIYLHPAETGHGFAEIKNISLGVVDLDITVDGAAGAPHDDLDTGVNAAVGAAYVATYLERFNRMAREKYRFDFGSFAGQPSFVLNIGSITADGGYGTINRSACIKCRIRFFTPFSIESAAAAVTEYVKQCCEEEGKVRFDAVHISKGAFRATPAMVENDHPFVKLIEKNIGLVTGTEEFIHQYHGGSDIRLPMLYGNSCCVGIGPRCELPAQGSGEMEWMSIDDYISGVKILASILHDYQNFSQ